MLEKDIDAVYSKTRKSSASSSYNPDQDLAAAFVAFFARVGMTPEAIERRIDDTGVLADDARGDASPEADDSPSSKRGNAGRRGRRARGRESRRSEASEGRHRARGAVP